MIKIMTQKNVKLMTEAEKDYEVHFNHYDVFYILKGSVKIYFGGKIHEENVKRYDKEKDIGFSKGITSPGKLEHVLKEGDHLIVPPGLLHKPCILNKEPTVDMLFAKINKDAK